MSTILIAEDDYASSKLLLKVCQGLGHTAIVSPNGQHALETLQFNEIDLLITDIMMPLLDGRDLMRKLRASEQYKDLPIIVVSAYVGPQDVAELLSIGATFVIMKPTRPDEVREYVERALGKG